MNNQLILTLLVAFINIPLSFSNKTPITYLMLIDKTQQAIPQQFEERLRDLQFYSSDRHHLFITTAIYDARFPEESLRRACRSLRAPINAIFDFTLGGWPSIIELANITGTPYLQVELTEGPYYRTVAEYVQNQGATRAAFIFQQEIDMIAAEFALGTEFQLEITHLVGLNHDSKSLLKSTLHPEDYIAIFSTSNRLASIFNQIIADDIAPPEKVIVVLLDFEMSAVNSDLDDLGLNLPSRDFTLVRPSVSQMCCPLLNDLPHYCKCTPKTQVIPIVIMRVADLFLDLVRRDMSIIRRSQRIIDYCNLTMDENLEQEAIIFRNRFQNLILDVLPQNTALEFDWDKKILGYQTVLEVLSVKSVPMNNTYARRLKRSGANIVRDHVVEISLKQVAVPPTAAPTAPTTDLFDPKKVYIVAFLDEEPWSYRDGNRWIGFCVDLMQKLSEMLKISFTAIRINDMGSRVPNAVDPDGPPTFTGVIGQVARGDVDIIAAPIPVTTDKDDYINFVEPYFERNGLIIVTMLPQISKSLFKFMTVLSPAVWLSTFGGLVAMSIFIYVLEILSPFSYRNDPASYPYPCRVFSYKECIWFAATSFTPQGGGEAPRALSARVVVFGFWIFVVLMLSTFTSNLAAFLTVERAQSAITSLEALAKQTRVMYGVQKGGRAYSYFQNMKDAEDNLYRLWVDRVEQATGDAANVFRTWNYPIREMYKIVWEQMSRNGGFLDTPADGIKRVLDHPDGSYAFIHDSSWVKYEVLQDCKLAEVGDIFGEQPVALVTRMTAESLSNNLSEAILTLNRDRYFEELTAKHWNQTFRTACDGDKNQEGMSMESIGGIFIFTFGGLGVSFLTVLLEVLYQRKFVVAKAKRTAKSIFGTTGDSAPRTSAKKKKKHATDAKDDIKTKNEKNKPDANDSKQPSSESKEPTKVSIMK